MQKRQKSQEAQERAEAERARIRKMEDEAVTAESPLVHRRAESGSHFRENIPVENRADDATRKADENEIDLIRFKRMKKRQRQKNLRLKAM